jgi:GH25 family lysozyme M1 (1,4-beta-N-acetylmuramidase)
MVPINLSRTSNDVVDFGYDDGEIDFVKAQTEGLRCIFHRLTGMKSSDTNYPNREKLARRSEILWGAYHYGESPLFHLGDAKTQPRAQADRFLRAVMNVALMNHTSDRSIILILDIEGRPRMNLREAAAFAGRVEEVTGKYPGLYVNYGDLCTDAPKAPPPDSPEGRTLSNCWLWISTYRRLAQPWFFVPTIWQDWTMWQYCGDDTRSKRQWFYTALPGKEYSGTSNFFQRSDCIWRAGTEECVRNVADRNLFNGGSKQWRHFVRTYTTKVIDWNFGLTLAARQSVLRDLD